MTYLSQADLTSDDESLFQSKFDTIREFTTSELHNISDGEYDCFEENYTVAIDILGKFFQNYRKIKSITSDESNEDYLKIRKEGAFFLDGLVDFGVSEDLTFKMYHVLVVSNKLTDNFSKDSIENSNVLFKILHEQFVLKILLKIRLEMSPNLITDYEGYF
jgi:hypothetical protein